MRKAVGQIVYLVDAIESQRMLWVFCLICGHSQRVHPWALARRGGGLQTLQDVAKKCRCRHCGKQDALVAPSRMSFEGRG